MSKLSHYLKRAYLLSLNLEKQKRIVWNRLKKFLDASELTHGIYEKERAIEAFVEISDGKTARFYYYLFEDYLFTSVRFLKSYPSVLTNDIFILATHFNNLLNHGVVIVNVNDGCVDYIIKKELVLHLLTDSAIENQISSHYNTAKDISSAFQRLIEENEAPAIIIADLFKDRDQ